MMNVMTTTQLIVTDALPNVKFKIILCVHIKTKSLCVLTKSTWSLVLLQFIK